MASLSDELTCSICLDIYKDPVMLPCGHNFCQECLKCALDFHNQSRIYTCPECRRGFQQRPTLLRNLKLGHVIQSLQEDSRKKLQQSLLELTSERKATEKRLESLKEQKSKIQESSRALEKVMNMFFMMILKDIKKCRRTVLEEISRKKDHALMQVSRLTPELEIRKQELSRKIQEIQKLLQVGDLTTVQRPEIEWGYHQSDSVALDLDEMPINLTFKRFLSSATHMFSELIQSIPGPKTLEILLDVKTACNYILVSPDCKSASYISADQGYPEGPERFAVSQVLSSCSFSAQHYWVVDVRKAKEWIVGVAYHSMDRKTLDHDAYIGFNKKSWGLEYRHSLSALHNKVREEVTLSSPVELLGVYVNYGSGVISFYQLSDRIRHLYSFFATFTDCLHAAFCLFPDSCITVHKKEPRPKSGFVKKGFQMS